MNGVIYLIGLVVVVLTSAKGPEANSTSDHFAREQVKLHRV